MMKLEMTGYFRRSPMWRDRLAHLLVLMFFLAISAHADERVVAAVGGPMGSEFVARCPPGQFLGGLEMRTGDDIDAVRPLCRKTSSHVEKFEVQPGDPRYDPYAHTQKYDQVVRYDYGDAIATTGWYGGPGGSARTLLCALDTKNSQGGVISALGVESEGVDTVTVNGISLLCEAPLEGGGLPTSSRDDDFPRRLYGLLPRFEAPRNSDAQHGQGTSICPIDRDNRATFAVGIHGRAGGVDVFGRPNVWVDALGLICDYPVFPQLPVVLGRVQGSTPAPPPERIDGEPMICAYARSARTRNSPAAPSLEAQCEVARRALPPVALGRIHSTTPSPPIIPLDGELPICARARDARARNSPAAPSLQRRCDADRAGAANHVVTRAPSNAAEIAGSRAGIFTQPSAAPAPPAAQPPVEQPPAAQPPVAQAPAKPGNAFMPPTYVDGAQLWACANAVQGKVKGAACRGLQAGRMYCRRHGFSGALQTRADGTPDLMVAAAQPGSPVRAGNGDVCTANDCAVISELRCAP